MVSLLLQAGGSCNQLTATLPEGFTDPCSHDSLSSTSAPCTPPLAGYAGSGDSGKLAQFISNSSFVLLSLIYTFTELLDLSDQVSAAGLASWRLAHVCRPWTVPV